MVIHVSEKERGTWWPGETAAATAIDLQPACGLARPETNRENIPTLFSQHNFKNDNDINDSKNKNTTVIYQNCFDFKSSSLLIVKMILILI